MSEKENVIRELEQRLEEYAQVSSIVVHDLRSPLASMRMYFDMALSDNPNLRKHSENMKAPILELCQYMSQLLDNYSDHTKIDAQCAAAERYSCDLAELVKSAKESCADLIARSGVEEIALPPDLSSCPVMLDRGLFTKALHKLLGEAVILAPDCTGVEVSLETEGEGEENEKEVTLSIIYRGAWNVEELQSLLEIDLAKLKEERDSERRMHGLVFGIVKKIMSALELGCHATATAAAVGSGGDGDGAVLIIRIPRG